MIVTIKAGVTCLSWLIVFAAHYQVMDINCAEIAGREIFRDLGSCCMQGVPLAILDRKSESNFVF